MEDIRTLVGPVASLGFGIRNVQRATRLGSIAVAETELSRQELSAAGRYFFGGNQVIASGVAPVTAIPTTTGSANLYNAATDGLTCLVIDYIAGPWLGSGTAAAGATLFVGLSSAKMAGTIPVANMSNWTSVCANGAANRQTNALWDATATFTAAKTSWISVGSNFQLAAANVGQGGPAFIIHGGIVIPPGYALGIAALSAAGTSPLYGWSVGWAEVPLVNLGQ
jgi:hypothetical protein